MDEGYDYASAAHVTSAGALLVAGVVENSSGRQLGLVQLDAVTGEFDPVFNGGQPLEYDPCEDVPQGCFLSVDAVMRTASGRVVIAGGKDYRMFAARLLTNLAPDETFGDLNGMATTPAGGYFWASGGAVLQGENIVLGGWHGDLLNDDEDFALLRLSGGGDLFRDSFEVSP